jgi:hypothetical protein
MPDAQKTQVDVALDMITQETAPPINNSALIAPTAGQNEAAAGREMLAGEIQGQTGCSPIPSRTFPAVSRAFGLGPTLPAVLPRAATLHLPMPEARLGEPTRSCSRVAEVSAPNWR